MGDLASYAASPSAVKTSVRLWVRLVVRYSSRSCMDKEKVLFSGSKDMTNALIASKGFWIRCFRFSFALSFRKNPWALAAIWEIKSFRSSTSICLQKIPVSSADFCRRLSSTVFPTPRRPLKITDWVGMFMDSASNIRSTVWISSSLPAR